MALAWIGPSEGILVVKFVIDDPSIADVVPAVDVGALARNQSGRAVSEKGGRGTDIIDADQALGRCPDSRHIKQGLEFRDSESCTRNQRVRRDRMHRMPFGPTAERRARCSSG